MTWLIKRAVGGLEPLLTHVLETSMLNLAQ
jgi:hypothetical protein